MVWQHMRTFEIWRWSRRSLHNWYYLSKKALDADSEATQQINFTGNLDRDGNTTILSVIEASKQNILGFSQETVWVLQTYFVLI